MRDRSKVRIYLGVGTAILLLGPVGPAGASNFAHEVRNETAISVLRIGSPGGPPGDASLELYFDNPTQLPEVEADLEQAFHEDVTIQVTQDGSATATSPIDPIVETGPLAPISRNAKPPTPRSPRSATSAIRTRRGGSGYHDIYCNSSYAFSDADGTFSVQRACGVQKAPWGFYTSAFIQSICVSMLSEAGMSWLKNGVVQPRNTSHFVPETYLIHGTFNPVARGDLVDYSDDIYFYHNVGGGGEAHLRIFGRLKFRGNG